MNEKQAYQQYVASCHSNPNEFVSEFNFLEWRALGRPKGRKISDGYWGPIWKETK